MPLLDTSEILSDPDFVDTSLTYARNTQTVGSDGLAVDTPTTLAFSGVVIQGAGKELHRREDGSYISGDIVIYTRSFLTEGSPGTDADVIAWRGKQYTVVLVEDWGTYGVGYYRAVCNLIPLGG